MASYSATSGGAVTLDYATAEVWGVTLTSDCTITLAGAINGTASPITAILMQDATGGRTVTWPASVVWEGGVAPVINSSANESTVVSVFTVDGGASWVGFTDGAPPRAVLAGPYMTYGGTANAVTLTSVNQKAIASLVTGMQLRFRATAENTGAMTINPDGLGAITVKTITGVDTPADYIRTDVDTVVTYDGTHFIADRQIERGSNANGEYVRWADGTQSFEFLGSVGSDTTCSTAMGGGFRTSVVGPFSTPANFINDEYGIIAGRTGGDSVLGFDAFVASASTYSLVGKRVTSGTILAASTFQVIAIGRWY